MEPGQEQRLNRRFGLGDVLILMAALALTLFMLRATGWFARIPARVADWWETSQELLRLRPWGLQATRGRAASSLAANFLEEIFVGLLSSVLLGLTLVQPLLRLRRPRPPLREVILQPGFVACLCVIVGTLTATDLWWFLGTMLGTGFSRVWPCSCSSRSSGFSRGGRRRAGSTAWAGRSDGAGSSRQRAAIAVSYLY